MKLCFDATRFGSGLEGAIELASARDIPGIEYSLSAFNTAGKGREGSALSSREKSYFQRVHEKAKESSVSIECLNLDYLHSPGEKRAGAKLNKMISKLAALSSILECPRISLYLSPGQDRAWISAFESEYLEMTGSLDVNGVSLLLRLSTPAVNVGTSLKRWIAMEPQDWRDLAGSCPGLKLSFSAADCLWMGIDYLSVLPGIISAVDHIEIRDVEMIREILKDSGIFGPLFWRYRMMGKGQVDWRQLIELLKLYDFEGSVSLHLEDEFIESDLPSLESALDSGIRELTSLLK